MFFEIDSRSVVAFDTRLLITSLPPSLAPEVAEMFLNLRPPKLSFSLQKTEKKSDLKLFLFHLVASFQQCHFR
jgi:hypothetical protein